MSPSLLFWVAAAALLFWSVGAYNRLVRLRSEANMAFTALEIELTRQVQLVQSFLPAQDEQAAPLDGDSVFWTSLGGAASQFAASLAAARNRPLERGGIEALGAAQDVLATAWERAERDDAHDMVGRYTLEIAPGQIEKVLLGAQNIAACVIQIQKRLQIGKGIGLAQRLDIGIG